jgi:hypothetical protein
MLHTLGMAATADQLAPALEAAERDKRAYSEFLAGLLEHEVVALAQKRLAGRLRFAKLPTRSEALARTRTVDPFLTMEVLYQLSYEGARRSVSGPRRR